MILRLKDIYEFRGAHPGAEVAFRNPDHRPRDHFNLLFRCLFGLSAIKYRCPHRIIDMIKRFLHWTLRTAAWFARRCAKYRWALRTRRGFLWQAITDRRSRIAAAVDQWQALEADADHESQARLEEELARRHDPKQPAPGHTRKGVRGLLGMRRRGLLVQKPPHTPQEIKWQVGIGLGSAAGGWP